MLWSDLIYYSLTHYFEAISFITPLTHQFEAIKLVWIKTCVKWFWDKFDWDWQTETWVIVYYLGHTQNSWIQDLPCISFVNWIIHWSLTDRQADQKTSILVVVIHVLYIISSNTNNINYVYESKTNQTKEYILAQRPWHHWGS